MLDFLLMFLPMLLFMGGSWFFFKVIYQAYAEKFDEKYGVKPQKWPLRLMLGTLVITFAIPYFLNSFFDPIDMFDSDGGVNETSLGFFLKLLLACIPAIIFSLVYLYKKTNNISSTLAATGLTIIAAFAGVFFYVLKTLLLIVKWLAVVVFQFGMSEGVSKPTGRTVYRCSNCQTELSSADSHCPCCGATFN